MIATEKDSLGPVGLTKGRAEAALAGTTLADRYDILELLGVGGMGAVYRARDRELDDLVALKVIRRELAAMPAMVERFRHEVKLARRVTHVNVARTFELGTSNGLMYCTMELVEGESLSQRLEQRRKVPIAEAVSIVSAVCDGLATAHAANVIHRDIKPDNILLANDGRVVIADFGVAAVGVGVGKVGELSGTPAYMAPEQARGEAATPASDVYALATVLYELVTGKRAFPGEAMTVISAKQDVERLMPAEGEVPPELATVIGNATAREPAARTATAAAFRAALAPWAKSDAIAAPAARARDVDADLTTIVVIAPQAPGHPQLYLAEAVHEALLARLSRMPRVRVLPRVIGRIDDNVVGVCLDLVEDRFGVRITPPRGQTSRMELPLAPDQVEEAADAIAAALGVMLRPRKHVSTEAIDLLLKARHMLGRDFTSVPEGFAHLERAYELAPDEPRVAANYLIAKVRLAFFRSASPHIQETCALARKLVVLHPDLADAQLAAGHVELAVGDPLAAARHFRAAIRCAPLLAEAHEQLGRMLLEAGYMEAALERLDEAIAIAPNLRTARWEILRAYALDERWAEFDDLLAELLAMGGDRPLARSRYLWWRKDWVGLADARQHITQMDRTLWPGMMERMFDVFLDNHWGPAREELVSAANAPIESHRRIAFVCQLGAEAAAFANDIDTAITLLTRAIDKGLFDLHWMDHCVMLAPVRTDPRFAVLRRLVKERADSILDALYGDVVAVSETVAQ